MKLLDLILKNRQWLKSTRCHQFEDGHQYCVLEHALLTFKLRKDRIPFEGEKGFGDMEEELNGAFETQIILAAMLFIEAHPEDFTTLINELGQTEVTGKQLYHVERNRNLHNEKTATKQQS